MKRLIDYIKESIFDIGDKIENFDEDLHKTQIEEFLKANYKGTMKCKISKNPNEDGKYIVDSKYAVIVTNLNLTALTNDLFVWGEVAGNFSCYQCHSLTSLKGAPKEVGYNFYCEDCSSLKSLEGAPEKVAGSFSCERCTSLTSLKGAPKEVGRDFRCNHCKTQFTKADVKKVSSVKRNIYC